MIEKKARLMEILYTMDGKRRLVFDLAAGMTESEAQSIAGKDLSLTVREWKAKRSLDANAYYWVLVTKLAEAVKVSKPRMHNLLLRRYGQQMILDGQRVILMIPDTEEAENAALEASTFHIRPTANTRRGEPVDFRAYVVLRGSSDYDTKEMSVLLDGTVEECKQAGIETATPDEIQRMKELYARNHSKR